MKIALAQIAPALGDLKKNLEIHLDNIEKAKNANADLVIFPELSLTGYSLKDMVPDAAADPEKDENIARLRDLSQDIGIVFGFVEEKDNGLFFNSAAFLSGGRIQSIHRKVFLPTYGMFEEAKFYAQGKNFKTFPTPWAKTGMMICYDFLNYGASYLLFVGGSDMIIVLSAAPGRGVAQANSYETSHMWELMGETISRFSTAFVIYCNRVGFEDGISFAGGSFIFSPSGQLLAKAPYVDEDLLIKEIDLNDIKAIRKKWPYKRDQKPEIIHESLKRIIKSYED
jgi:predicted amidohydrolase